MTRIISLSAACVMIFMALSCQDPAAPQPHTNPDAVLQEGAFIVRSTDYQNLCQSIFDTSAIFYRNSDTLRVIVRNLGSCPPYVLSARLANDTIELFYSAIQVACNDTLRMSYLEYGFKIESEGSVLVIARDSTRSTTSIDTLIETSDVTEPYSCPVPRIERTIVHNALGNPFPLDSGNLWVYSHSTSSMFIGAPANDSIDKVILRVVSVLGDTFNMQEEMVFSDPSLNSVQNEFYVRLANDTLWPSESTTIFPMPLCLNTSLIDTSNATSVLSITVKVLNSYLGYSDVVEYRDPGMTPVDGCGGLLYRYSGSRGAMYVDYYCGWNVADMWTLE